VLFRSLFSRAGEYPFALRELEKAGDYPGLAACYAKMGKFLEAANAVEKTDAAAPEKIDEIEGHLFKYLEARPGDEEQAVEALHAEAERLLKEGRWAGAAARFRLLQDDARAAEALHGLGLHEMAIELCLEAKNPRLAVRYAKLPDVAVPVSFVEMLVGALFSDSHRSGEAREQLTELVFALLAHSPAESFPAGPRATIESMIETIFHGLLLPERIPAVVFELLVGFKIVNVIARLLDNQRLFKEEPTAEMVLLVQNLRTAARETGDPDLAACAALAEDSTEFEKAASGLALSVANVRVLGLSSGRYREAVDWLMNEGRIGEAESICRAQHDMALSATYAEKRGDNKGAALDYAAAHDYEAALRCYTVAEDGRGIARMMEKLGRRAEAIAQWEKLGSSREAERLRRKG
jgi:tetratricopeptide (TPR) repeat protein